MRFNHVCIFADVHLRPFTLLD